MTDRRCASLCIQDGGGRVLLVRQAYGGRYWGFPGGVVGAGESPREAAIREVAEEVGVEAVIDEQIGEYVLTGGGWPDIRASVYSGHAVSGKPGIQDANEIAEIRWVDPHSPPAELLPDAEAGLADLLGGRTGVTRRHERKIRLPEWSEPDGSLADPSAD